MPLVFVPDRRPLSAGLHFVSTPIGAARDITLRALDTLALADVLAAEDTRTLRHLMEIHRVPLNGRRVIAYHDHNGGAVRPRLIGSLDAGRTVAYASEAGTPLVADPGFRLARAAIDAGHAVHSVPGPSALLAALTVSGLPTDRFLFAGFPPATREQRRKWLGKLASLEATIVLYESPRRTCALVRDVIETMGPERDMALCRELTKRFETVIRGTAVQVLESIVSHDLKGEVVLVLGGASGPVASEEDFESALDAALRGSEGRIKDVAARLAEQFAMSRRDVYQAALRREKK